jgi:tRNA (adenine57-N1/adenine58-N1)-methyltransferase
VTDRDPDSDSDFDSDADADPDPDHDSAIDDGSEDGPARDPDNGTAGASVPTTTTGAAPASTADSEADGDGAGRSATPVLLVHEDREYLRLPGEELHTDLGVVDVPDDVTPGDRLETHLGEPFVVRPLRGPDLFEHFERTGAPMMPRDIGLIVGHTGAATGDRVLDAGTGTGVLAAYLGRIGADVVTYERDPEFAAVARENMRLAGVGDRVEVRTGDVLEDLDRLTRGDAGTESDPGAEASVDAESAPDRPADGPPPTGRTDAADAADAVGGRFDLLTLDTADAPAVVERAPSLLVEGGFLAAYTPFVEGTRAVVEAARGVGYEPKTFETIQRRLDVDDRGTRPSTAGVGHTGYLTFARAPLVGSE